MRRWSISLLLLVSLGCSHGPLSGGPKLSVLIKQLKEGDKSDRKDAMRKLEEFGPGAGEAVPLLVEALKDEAYDIRDAASDALKAIGKPAVASLAEALKDENQWSPRHATRILGEMGKDAAEAVPALVAATRSEDHIVKTSAITAIGEIGPEAAEAVGTLIELLKDRSISSYVFSALVEIGEPGIPALSKALRDRNHDVRTSAVNILGEIGPAAIPALMDLLKVRVGFVDVANDAIYQLGEIGPEARDAIPLLVGRFGYDDEKNRRAAGLAVAKIGRDAVPALLSALEHSNVVVGATACEAIGRMQPPPAEALGKLIILLRHQNRGLRAYAGRAIGKYGSRAEKAIPALVVYLRQSKHKNTARKALSKIGKPAVPALVLALSDKEERVRASVAGALGDIGPDASDAIGALTSLFQDDSAYVRSFALTALYDIGPNEKVSSLQALIEVLKKDTDRRVRAHAARTIGKVAAGKKRAIAALILALDDRDQTVVRSALKALRQMQTEPSLVVSTYAKLLRHKDIGIRMKVAEALGELGPKAGSAVPALRNAINDKYDKYGHAQESAADALRKIDPDAVHKIKET